MNPLIDELVRVNEERAAAVLVTVVDIQGARAVKAGAKCLVRDGKIQAGDLGHPPLAEAVLMEADRRLREGKSKLVALELPASGEKAEVYFDVMLAPPRLVVVGAGHIAVPLVKFAKQMDFQVTVIDDRIQYANRDRFPDADDIVAGDMAEALREMPITPWTYIVLITRGHKYDEPCLREVIHSSAKYIGMIGSKRRVKACFHRFREEEKIAEEIIAKVFAPIGLDISAETPEEIALAILAEVIKVRRGGKAESLSGR
ncbi:MAG TPA: XdhC/CoxI family protein [Candidatus Binatia bacterium]